MQIPAPIQAPSVVSARRRFEQELSDLHKSNNLNQLKQIHALIYKSNLHQDHFIIPKLVTAYSLCRQMPSAVLAFKQIDQPNVHLYNSIIKAHVRNYRNAEAFETFILMQRNGVFPDGYTYPLLLKACEDQFFDIQIVKMIHTHIEKRGFYSDIYVPNALVERYLRFGSVGVADAKKLFNVMQEKNIVCWNSILSGLVKANCLADARKLFDEMPERDAVSWNTMLDGYAKARQLSGAFELFEKMPGRDVVSWSTMIWGYSKAGDMEMAKTLFDMMPVKNMISWTIITTGYAEKGFAKEAACLFEQMLKGGFKPDDGFFVSILAACTESGLLKFGRRVHRHIKKNKYRCNTIVESALVDMYARCGGLIEALKIFNRMDKKDLVAWNTMIHGLAMHGRGEEALQLFSKMRQQGFAPDKMTFNGVLCACSCSGFVDKGIQYFYTMEKDFGVVPDIYHYGCVIDLLGRAGRLEDALRLVHTMPFEPNAVIWSTLSEAGQIHNAGELTQEVPGHLMKLEPTNPGNSSMSSNILLQAGLKNTAVANVR